MISKRMSTSDNFFSGITIQTVVSLVNAVLQMIVFAILSRLLTKTEFGYYAALIGITMIFMCLSDAGIGSAVVQKKDLSEKYVSTAFTLSIICGALISVLFIFLSPIVGPLIIDDTLLLPLILMSIPLFLHSINGFAVGYLRRELKFGTLGICKIISYTVSSSIAIYVAYRGGGLLSLLVLIIFDAVIYTILVFFKTGIPKLSIGKNEAKDILSFGGWLTMGSIVSSIANQIDKLVLGKWLTVEKLGAYNRPTGFITNIIGQMNVVFDSVLFPVLSEFQDSKEKFRDLLYRSYGLLSTIGTLLSATLFFNSKLIIIVFFGNQWLDLVVILRIASLSAIFMLNNTLADCFFRSFNLVKQGFFIRSAGLLLGLAFLYFGVQYDILGVALSVFLSNFIVVIFKLIYLCRKSGAEIREMMKYGIRAFIPALPIVAIGVIFEFFLPTTIIILLETIVILLVLAIELLKFPGFIGAEYKSLIYSKIVDFLPGRFKTFTK